MSFLTNIPFSYLWIMRRAIGNDIKTVLDLGCGQGEFMTDLSAGERWKITGVEIFPEAINKAEATGTYDQIYQGSITKLPPIISKQKYDLVFSSQVVEHLDKSAVVNSLSDWESLAAKRVVISTTVGYMDYEPLEKKEENNPYQKHQSGWLPGDFRKRGYKVYGQGLKYIYGHNGLARKTPLIFLPLWSAIALLFAPLVYFIPEIGLIMICRKNK